MQRKEIRKLPDRARRILRSRTKARPHDGYPATNTVRHADMQVAPHVLLAVATARDLQLLAVKRVIGMPQPYGFKLSVLKALRCSVVKCCWKRIRRVLPDHAGRLIESGRQLILRMRRNGTEELQAALQQLDARSTVPG